MAENNNQPIRPTQRKSRKRKAGNMYLVEVRNSERTPRLKTTYPDYLKIKQNISQRLHPTLGATFEWINEEKETDENSTSGAICNACDNDV
eukprot:166142_1